MVYSIEKRCKQELLTPSPDQENDRTFKASVTQGTGTGEGESESVLPFIDSEKNDRALTHPLPIRCQYLIAKKRRSPINPSVANI